MMDENGVILRKYDIEDREIVRKEKFYSAMEMRRLNLLFGGLGVVLGTVFFLIIHEGMI